MNAVSLYRAATTITAPLVAAYLRRRLAKGKEDAARIAERRGIASQPRPPGSLVWVHAASVGESQSALALIGRLVATDGGPSILVTSGTLTSARLLEQRLPPETIHQFVPVDVVGWVRRFLDHWQPDLALFIESEIWPNLITETAGRGCPLVLINGRMSARSFRRWHRVPSLARTLMGRFALCLGQTEDDRERLAALGARRAEYLGNLKYSAAPLPADEQALGVLCGAIGKRPRWLAASTHPGEEALAAAVHRQLRSARPDLLTIIAPRHPARGDEIAAQLAGDGLHVGRRSNGAVPDADDDIYLADTLGELGLFYRLAGIAFIGGSTVAVGGHNPLEAGQLNCAILHGPDMSNFTTVASDLKAAGAAIEVADAAELAAAVGRLLDDPDLRKRYANGARKVTAANADALERVLEALAPFLAALPQTPERGS